MNADPFFGTSGIRNASIVLVGEAWGFEELAEQKPFVGQSGKELDRMLIEAGIPPISVFKTNVIAAKPQNNEMWRFFYEAKTSPVPALRGLHPMPLIEEGLRALYSQLSSIRPKVVVALGNYALWALTNCCSYHTSPDSKGRRIPSGIMSWRGSLWYCDAAPGDLAKTPLVPLIHPTAILRTWYNRAVSVHDLRQRVNLQGLSADWRPKIKPTVWAPPTFEQARSKLGMWWDACKKEPLRLVNDIETARGLITCIGFADSPHFAMTIPFIKVQPGQTFESYWSPEEEFTLVSLMRKLLQHPNCLVEGQNYLYDTQYIQEFLQCTPNLAFDSMLAHHLLFPGTPKGLDYLSSLYCKYHWYWKEDHKEWDLKGTLETLLRYNAEDCLRNFEINTELRGMIPKMGQAEQWKEELQKNALALRMMNRGVKIDKDRRAQLALELSVAAGDAGEWFKKIIPQHIVSPDADPKKVVPWFQSAQQQRRFFKEDLGLNLPKNRKTDQDSFGKEALQVLTERHPEFTRLFEGIGHFRSIKTFHNNFIGAELEHDFRMKCMFNTSGTETFRWSSSTNAFNRGTNLQNIPAGDEE